MAVKLSQGLKLKQSQTLTMTPQLQQAIKMLTLTHTELTEVIATEMVENPMLEEFGAEVNVDQKSESDYKVDKLENQTKEAVAENFEEPTVMAKDDFDWNSYVEAYENSSYTPPNMAKQDFDELPNYENIVSSGKNLAEHLELQLRMENLTEDEWKVADSIIYNIDEGGYLDESIEVIISKTGHDREDSLEILKMIQNLDPVGCGSRDLQECLYIQARALTDRAPLVELIIKEHMSLLERGELKGIAKITGVEEEVVKEALFVIHNFHPKPGRLVSGEDTHFVVPDIYVVESDGEFSVRLNDEGVPKLRISKLYMSMLKDKENKEAQDYVKEKLNAAKTLMESIYRRQDTIFKVAEAIVERQQNFFKKGPKFLKPMILKDIADEIGRHESSVSRATTNKYMHTPIGLFELKYFFNTGLGGKNGSADIASEVLKIKIKELVAKENPAKPLSDQKIGEVLSREDVKIARRTVAKYRESLGILSSAKRKKRE